MGNTTTKPALYPNSTMHGTVKLNSPDLSSISWSYDCQTSIFAAPVLTYNRSNQPEFVIVFSTNGTVLKLRVSDGNVAAKVKLAHGVIAKQTNGLRKISGLDRALVIVTMHSLEILDFEKFNTV